MTNFIYKNDLPSDLNLGQSIAIDTETMVLKTKRDRLCVVQISSGDGNAHLVLFDGKDYRANNLCKLLADINIEKIFHYARFDMAAIKHYLNVNVTNVYCTKIASKLARTYSDSHGLKTLCEELVSVEISKKQQSSDWGSSEISQAQIKYAAQDVLYLHKIKSKLEEIIIRENRTDIYRRCIEFLPTRVALDLQGFDDVDIFSH